MYTAHKQTSLQGIKKYFLVFQTLWYFEKLNERSFTNPNPYIFLNITFQKLSSNLSSNSFFQNQITFFLHLLTWLKHQTS